MQIDHSILFEKKTLNNSRNGMEVQKSLYSSWCDIVYAYIESVLRYEML